MLEALLGFGCGLERAHEQLSGIQGSPSPAGSCHHCPCHSRHWMAKLSLPAQPGPSVREETPNYDTRSSMRSRTQPGQRRRKEPGPQRRKRAPRAQDKPALPQQGTQKNFKGSIKPNRKTGPSAEKQQVSEVIYFKEQQIHSEEMAAQNQGCTPGLVC